MNEELSFNQLLDADLVEDLFTTSEESQESLPDKQSEPNKKDTTEVDADDLFATPESVGSGEDNNQVKEDATDKGKSASPNKSFYSSIAPALKEEGILQNLDDESLKNVKTPEDFAAALEKEIQLRLDEKLRRIDEALQVGVEPDEVRKYESTLEVIESVTDDLLKDESDKGESLRKQLIYQDYINRGFSSDRAKRLMEKSFSDGTDIEDAKEALESNKDFFSKRYQALIADAKEEEKRELEIKKQLAEKIKKSILEGEVFKDLELDPSVRLKAFNAVSKPVFKDKDGNWYTEIQQYEMNNREEFLSKLGLIFTLTDGFKDLNKLVNKEVRKKTRQSLRELEHTLNNTAWTPEGTLNYASGLDDEHSKINWSVDV